MKKIGILIQVRTGSKRLHNKIFKKLDKNNLIEWIIKRLAVLKKETEIILVTTKKKEDKKIFTFAKKNNLKIFFGSEKNVLNRFINAAKFYKIDTIIRVCGDNPFIDANLVKELINFYKKNKCDLAFNHIPLENFNLADGFGAEILSTNLLTSLIKKKINYKHKEHVTKYFYDNKNKYEIVPVRNKRNIFYPNLKFDINTKEDLKFIKKNILNGVNVWDNSETIVKKYYLKKIDNFLKDLFPLNRSIVSNENKLTLEYIKKFTNLEILKIKSKTKINSWSIPLEYKITDGWIKDVKNKKIVDFKKNKLHVANNSIAINKIIHSSDLINKLYHLKNHQKAIPYRTLYYNNDWGFSVSKKIFTQIKNSNQNFKVFINSEKKLGHMLIGEKVIKGKTKREILISTYICHPSMANDNLSGVIVTALLCNYVENLPKKKWSYRFVFAPETIGAIAYCKIRKKNLKKIDFGLAINNCGGPSDFSFKESFDQNHQINFLIEEVFRNLKIKYKKYNFDIHGSDERQFSSLDYRINLASIFKSKYYEYKEYHTSADDLNFVNPENIFKSFEVYKNLIDKIEEEEIYENKHKSGEVMLSKYNLYPKDGGSILPNNSIGNLDLILWLLFLSDGKASITRIAKKLRVSKNRILNIYKLLLKKKLVKKIV